MIDLKCGDCLEIMKDMPYKSIDLIITSPPYNMTKRKGGYADTGRYDKYIDWKPEKEYLLWIEDVFNSFENVLVSNGVILFNFSYSIENPSLPYKLVNQIENNTPFVLVDTIIWRKNNGIPFPANKYRLSRIWEFIFVFVRKSEIKTFNINRKIKSISSKTKQKYYEVVYNYIEAKNNDEVCKLNQATFSSDMVTKLLNIYGKENITVLDPFMGTGTTGVACAKFGCSFVGNEISLKQFEYAKKRIENVSNSKVG